MGSKHMIMEKSSDINLWGTGRSAYIKRKMTTARTKHLKSYQKLTAG